MKIKEAQSMNNARIVKGSASIAKVALPLGVYVALAIYYPAAAVIVGGIVILIALAYLIG